jgi:uncharacterized OB-fold protein
MSASVADWTRGGEGVAYQACRSCGAHWYFHRTFCPRCGQASPEDRTAGGEGSVHAVTVVARAPSEAMRAHAPYAIVLVDADEGFRLMAHGALDLRIGDRVRCRFGDLAGRLVPYFEKP